MQLTGACTVEDLLELMNSKSEYNGYNSSTQPSATQPSATQPSTMAASAMASRINANEDHMGSSKRWQKLCEQVAT